MILFTSDLDRTLIFSKRMMEEHPTSGGSIAVEQKEDGQICTYMSEKSLHSLTEFHQKHLFVPVTTRALYQYQQIQAIHDQLHPKFAITSNGGTLLIDGKPDAEWDKLIKRRLAITSLPKEDMFKVFDKIRHEEWVLREFYIDDLFYMFHVEREKVPILELEAFGKELFEIGWRIFLHGKKLYILPYNLNKAFAVERLKGYVEYDIHIAAGDSLMDYDMLVGADKGYSPVHGELYEYNSKDPKIHWLDGYGAASAENMLEILLK